MKFLVKRIFDKNYKFIRNAIKGKYKEMDDIEFITKFYNAYRGGGKIDLENPKDIEQKMQWYKLYYRIPLMTQCCDKYAVRKYIESIGMGKYLIRLYGVYNTFEDIDFSIMPDKIYVKCNNGSGYNAIVRKNELNRFLRKKYRNYFASGLQKNYYDIGREWAYKNIKPKIVCEEVLESDVHKLVDFNFFCYNGKCRMIYMNIGLADENGHHSLAKRAVFDENLHHLNYIKTQMLILEQTQAVLPGDIMQIVKDAELISEPFPHARIDFFYIDGKYYFGEITFYSASGFMNIEPREFVNTMGEWFDLPEKKINI